MFPIQVADGYSVMMPKSTRSNASVMKARAMVRGYATPTTKTMTDTPPARATYKMRMNQISTGAVGLGIDGQTQAYIDVKGAKAKALFSSKNVPMTDGTELLTGCDKKVISQRGYGNIVARKPVAVPGGDRIGFNNTLVDTSKGKIEPSMAYTKTYPNHTVCSDFPKGPGGVEPNPMWEDGTYDEMLEQVQKVHNEVPREMAFVPEPDRRREVFNLQSLAGGEAFGEALFRTQLADAFQFEKNIEIEGQLRSLIPGITSAQIADKLHKLRVDKEAVRIARGFKVSLAAATEAMRKEIEELAELSVAQMEQGEAVRYGRDTSLGRHLAEGEYAPVASLDRGERLRGESDFVPVETSPFQLFSPLAPARTPFTNGRPLSEYYAELLDRRRRTHTGRLSAEHLAALNTVGSALTPAGNPVGRDTAASYPGGIGKPAKPLAKATSAALAAPLSSAHRTGGNPSTAGQRYGAAGPGPHRPFPGGGQQGRTGPGDVGITQGGGTKPSRIGQSRGR